MTEHPSTHESKGRKVTVAELIAAPFSTRSQADKERIVLAGRPAPSLWSSAVVIPENERNNLRKSDKKTYPLQDLSGGLRTTCRSAYDEFQWLTSSVATSTFHCWPCLLFQTPGLWNKSGISANVGQFEEHERSPEHIGAMFRLKTFIYQNLKAVSVQTVDMNREALRRLADVVCSFISLQKTPEANSCLKTMVFLRKYDGVNKCHSDDAIKLLKGSPEIVDRMVEAVAKVTRRSFAKAVQSSQYVSLILGRHSETKISSILRYVRNGKVEERFLGFSRVSGSASVYEHVKRLVDEFDIGPKCVALSVDGGLLAPVGLYALFTKLKTDAPHCTFAPWYSHPIDFVWQKSLSAAFPRCKKFFSCMSALENYFRVSPELCAALDDFAPEIGLRKVVGCGPTTDFLSCVQRNRLLLAEFFDSVLSAVTRWDADHVARAVGSRDCLRDETTAFLLNVFVRISRFAAPLKTALGSYVPERRFGLRLASDLVGELRLVQDQDSKPLLTCLELSPEEESCVRLTYDIMEQAIAEVQARYGELEKFQFCCLFDFLEEGWYQQSRKHLQDLKKCYHLNFNQSQAQNELAVLQQHGTFSKTSVYDFHQHLHDSNLKHTFTSLFDFSELVLALPFKHASLDHETLVWDKITKLSADPVLSQASDDSCFLFVESDYLLKIKQLPNFYDDVCAALKLIDSVRSASSH